MLKKGHIPWNKGKTGVYSEEHLNFLRNKEIGKKHSDETKRKISESKRGAIPWNKGVPVTEEMKKRISDTLKNKGISEDWRLKMIAGLTGKYRGEKHHSWRGGITTETYRIRRSTELILWRKACFERDNFTCQKTGQRGGRLVVHHINNFSDFPELRTSIENGITLSNESHKEFHNIYGYKNNTVEQLKEFLCVDKAKMKAI